MSKLYAIQDTTLTALGDAVRNKSKATRYELIQYPVDSIINFNTAEVNLDDNTLIENNERMAGFWYQTTHIPEASSLSLRVWMYCKKWGQSSVQHFKIHNQEITTANLANSKTPVFSKMLGNNIGVYGETILCSNTNIATCSAYLFADTVISMYIEVTALDENGLPIESIPKVMTTITKGQVKNTMTTLEMVDAINDLITVPNEALYLTGSCESRFSNNKWNWFVEYGDKIITNDITNISNMFHSSNQLISIPFDINMKISTSAPAERVFYNCLELRNIPMISNLKMNSGAQQMFFGCSNIRYFPEGFADDWDFSSMKSSSSYGMSNLFSGCFSLRKIPLSLIGNLCSRGTSTSSCSYYGLFSDCTSLDEINGLDVSQATLSSNCFSSNSFGSVFRLKDMTFAINEDGTSKTANWKNQTIDLSKAGYVSSDATKKYILNYNSGITADKEVTDDATYQALKDDLDWFSVNINYSRYNHDSVVNTINSLPDCSATGINTIKFKGTAGGLTDGGAINTLTEEEIAVATAKGWTVSLV